MGITTALIFQWVVFSENMNKFLAIACLAAVAVAKPEAEADPAFLYGAYGYASVSPSASTSIAGLAPAALPALAGGYAGAGRYVANSAGVVHVAKREAEAEADPYYAAYGYAGLGYAGAYGAYPYGLGYGYGGYANLGVSGAVNI